MHHSLSILRLNGIRQPQKHKNFLRILFVTINLFTAFYSALTFFISFEVKRNFDALSPVTAASQYEHYLGFALAFALISITLCVFGCYCADEKSSKGLLSYLMLTFMIFVFELTFVAYLLKFKGNFMEEVKNNFELKKAKSEWKLYPIMNELNCEESDCKEELEMFVGQKVDVMIYGVIGLIVWQVN